MFSIDFCPPTSSLIFFSQIEGRKRYLRFELFFGARSVFHFFGVHFGCDIYCFNVLKVCKKDELREFADGAILTKDLCVRTVCTSRFILISKFTRAVPVKYRPKIGKKLAHPPNF